MDRKRKRCRRWSGANLTLLHNETPGFRRPLPHRQVDSRPRKLQEAYTGGRNPDAGVAQVVAGRWRQKWRRRAELKLQSLLSSSRQKSRDLFHDKSSENDLMILTRSASPGETKRQVRSSSLTSSPSLAQPRTAQVDPNRTRVLLTSVVYKDITRQGQRRRERGEGSATKVLSVSANTVPTNFIQIAEKRAQGRGET